MTAHVPDADLANIVLHDLRFLARSWIEESNHDTIRDESARLRRLLVDAGGLLQRYRRSLGLRGAPVIKAIDMVQAIAYPWSEVVSAIAGGAYVHPLGMMMLHQVRTDHEPVPVGFPIVDYKLPNYLSTTAMIVRGQPVNRLQIINYVANKLGGVHYDTSRNRRDDAVYSLLDRERGSILFINDIDLVHFELLAIGQHLLRSPDVSDLLPDAERPTGIPDFPEPT